MKRDTLLDNSDSFRIDVSVKGIEIGSGNHRRALSLVRSPFECSGSGAGTYHVSISERGGELGDADDRQGSRVFRG